MEPSNENIDQYTTIQSITPEELENPEKSKIIKYLQYLSILFSILFSIAGMYYFLKGENKISPTIIQNNITKETIITQQVNSNVPKKLLSCVRYENDSDKKRIIEENLVNVIDKCPFKNQVNGKYRTLFASNTGAYIFFESSQDIRNLTLGNIAEHIDHLRDLLKMNDVSLYIEYNCKDKISLQKAWFWGADYFTENIISEQEFFPTTLFRTRKRWGNPNDENISYEGIQSLYNGAGNPLLPLEQQVSAPIFIGIAGNRLEYRGNEKCRRFSYVKYIGDIKINYGISQCDDGMRLHYGDCTIPFALPEEIKNCQIWTEHSLQANMSNKNAANETIMQFKCNAFDYVLDPESLLITVRTPI